MNHNVNPLQLDLRQPQWKRLMQKLDMVYYQCSMPFLENVQVLLSEVLEVRGSPLIEPELWSILCQAVEAIQDVFLRGHANKTKSTSVVITPSTLVCSSNGRVYFSATLVPKDVIQNTPFEAPEMFQMTEPTDEDIEKMLIYSLGQTLQFASSYSVDDAEMPKLSPMLTTVIRAMVQPKRDLRVNLLNTLQLVSQHAHKHIEEKPFSYYVGSLHREVLGSLPEMDILAQVEKDIAKEVNSVVPENVPQNCQTLDLTDPTANFQHFDTENNNAMRVPSASPIWDDDDNYLHRCTYGRRLEYRPPRTNHSSAFTNCSQASVPNTVCEKLTPRERWNWALTRLSQNKSRVKETSHDVSPAFAGAKAQASIQSVYNELRERKCQMERLRRDLDLPTGLRTSTSAKVNVVEEVPDVPTSRTMSLVDVVKQLCKNKLSRNSIKNDSSKPGTETQDTKGSIKKERSESCHSKTSRRSSSSSLSSEPKAIKLMKPSFKAPLYCTEDHLGVGLLTSGSEKIDKVMTGPEFAIHSCEPNIAISLIGKNAKETGSWKSVAKQVVVVLLNGQRLEVTCDTATTRSKHVFRAVIEHQNLSRKFLFGLAHAKDGEFMFLEPDQKLSKLAPLGWKEGNAKAGQPIIDCFTVYFRVKFYLGMDLIRDKTTKHLQYLQLRRDILERRTYCNEEVALNLGGLALQAEFGNYKEVMGKEYFLLEHYLPQHAINSFGIQFSRGELVTLHTAHYGLSRDLAELEFITKVQQLPEYGFHFHIAQQGKKAQSCSVWLGVCIAGVFVFRASQVENEDRKVVQQYVWKDVKRMSFDRRHFYLTPHSESLTGRYVKYKFYVSEHKGCFIFHMAASHHRLYMMLQCHSKVSEISFDDYAVKHGAESEDWHAEGILGEDEVGYELYSDHIRSTHGQPIVRRTRLDKRPVLNNQPRIRKAARTAVGQGLPGNSRGITNKQTSACTNNTRSWVTPCEDNVLPYQETAPKEISLIEKQRSFVTQNENLVNAHNINQGEILNAFSVQVIEPSESQRDEAYVIDASIRTERGVELSFLQEETISDSLAERFANLEDCPERFLAYVSLKKDAQKGYGLTLCCGPDLGAYVQAVFPDSPAALDGVLKPGDRIYAVNGRAIDGMEYADVVDLIRNCRTKLELLVSQLPQHDLSTIREEDTTCNEVSTISVMPEIVTEVDSVNEEMTKDKELQKDPNMNSSAALDLKCISIVKSSEERPSVAAKPEMSINDVPGDVNCSVEHVKNLNIYVECTNNANVDADGFLIPAQPPVLPAVRRKRSIKKLPAPSPPKPPRKCNLLKEQLNFLRLSTAESPASKVTAVSLNSSRSSVVDENSDPLPESPSSAPPPESPSSLKYRPPKPPRRSLLSGAKGKAPDPPLRGVEFSASRRESTSSCGSLGSENFSIAEIDLATNSTCSTSCHQIQTNSELCTPLSHVEANPTSTNCLEIVPNILHCDISNSVFSVAKKPTSCTEKASHPFSSLINQHPDFKNNNVDDFKRNPELKNDFRLLPDNVVESVSSSKLQTVLIAKRGCDNKNTSCCPNPSDKAVKIITDDIGEVPKIVRPPVPVPLRRSVVKNESETVQNLLPCCSPDCDPENCEILKYEKFVSSKFGGSSYHGRNSLNCPTDAGSKKISTRSWSTSASTLVPAIKSGTWKTWDRSNNNKAKANGESLKRVKIGEKILVRNSSGATEKIIDTAEKIQRRFSLHDFRPNEVLLGLIKPNEATRPKKIDKSDNVLSEKGTRVYVHPNRVNVVSPKDKKHEDESLVQIEVPAVDAGNNKHKYNDSKKIASGLQTEIVCLTDSEVGLTDSKVGLTYSNVGLTDSKVGLTDLKVGLTYSNVGLTDSEVALTYSKVGLTYSNVGLTDSKVGLTYSNVGLNDSKVGLTYSKVGLTDSKVGLQPESKPKDNILGLSPDGVWAKSDCFDKTDDASLSDISRETPCLVSGCTQRPLSVNKDGSYLVTGFEVLRSCRDLSDAAMDKGASKPAKKKMNQLDFCTVDDRFEAEVSPPIGAGDAGDVTVVMDNKTIVKVEEQRSPIKPGEIFHVVLEKTRGSLGLNIGGGRSVPSDPDGLVLVKNIVAGGAADVDGRLQIDGDLVQVYALPAPDYSLPDDLDQQLRDSIVLCTKEGDVILEVSGTNLVGATHHQAVDVLRSCPQLAHLTVQRGPTAVLRVHSPAVVENHGPRVAWQQQRTVTLSPPALGSLREEGRSEIGCEMGAVAAAMRCSEFATKSCSSPSPRKNGSDFSHPSPTRVLQNVILCSPTNEKGGSTPWTLPRSYSNRENGDLNRDIMEVQKDRNGLNLSPVSESPYKTTIRVSPRKNSSPSLPLLAEDQNTAARPRRNSADAWSTKVVVSNNVPDVIRLHVSFANRNAVNSNLQSCHPLQNGVHYPMAEQFQSNGDYQNGDLQRQISSSSDCSQRTDNALLDGRTVSPSVSCSSKFSSSCSSLNDETMSSSRSPTPQLASVASERRLSASHTYIANKNTSCNSECHSDLNKNDGSNCDSVEAVRGNRFQQMPSPIVTNDCCNREEDLPTVFTTNAARSDRRSVAACSLSVADPLALSTATKPKAAVLRLNSMSRSGSSLHERRRRRSSSCTPSSSGVDISVSQWEDADANKDGESDEEDSWESALLEEFPFICEDNIFEVCLEKNSRGLGLSVCGGWDSNPTDPFARLIRVKRLYPLQPAADSGLLQVGDILLTVNGVPLTGRMYFEAIEILRMAPAEVYLFVCRPDPGILPPIPQNTSLSGSGMLSSSSLDMSDGRSVSRYTGPIYTELDVTLTKVGGSLGFSLVKLDSTEEEEGSSGGGGHYIKALVKEPALSDGRLQPGDKIILVNGTDISEMSHAEAIKFLRELPDEVTLCLWREASSCPMSPLSPLSPTSPQLDETNRKRRPKPLLRKEALDMLSDKARQKARDGSLSTTSPRTSPRIKGPRPQATGDDDSPAPVHAPTLSRCGGFNAVVLPQPPPNSTGVVTALNLGEYRRVDVVDSECNGYYPMSSPTPPPSPPSHVISSSSEFKFADDTPGSNSSSEGFQEAEDCRTRHKPKRFHSEPVAVPSSRQHPSGTGDLPSTAGSFSCSESSSSSRPFPSPARPSFLDLTSGNLSPRKQMYGRGVVVATHKVHPPTSSAATTSSPSAVLTDDSDSSLRYLDESNADSLLATDDQLTTVTSSEDSPLAITLGNSALLKWRGATLASQENLTCDEKPDNSLQLQEQGSKSFSTMTVELDRGWNSRLGFSVVAVDNEEASGIYIKVVYPNSVAEGQLQPGDKLLKVNEASVTGLSAGDVILLLRKSSGKITLVIERYPDNYETSQPDVPKETTNKTNGSAQNGGSLTRSQSQHEELLSNEVSSLNAKNNNLSSRCFRWETRPSLQDENENFAAGRSHHRVNM